MAYKNYFPVALFFSIVLLLPLPWFKTTMLNQTSLDYSGFEVFSLDYPVVYVYVITLIILFLLSSGKNIDYLAICSVVLFGSQLFCFPTFGGLMPVAQIFSKSFCLTSFLVILLAILTIVSIQPPKRRKEGKS
ncbi:hypothetical protein [Enterococcus sp. AZ109]|uniref:hypothetical protein n=1 Tax=Enterococcus sp. AZ109 TaxID=2774634 RepID=UPI003F2306E6